jgi:RNA polymerase sigma-70 factor (ECF subfamily)
MDVSDTNDGISDEGLFDAIVKGDPFAMETLYQCYSRPLFSLAYRMTASKQVAEDLVQVAFLAVWRNRTAYSKEAGSVRSWLFSIMHYRILDYLRHWRFLSTWKEIPWENVEFAETLFVPDPWEETWRLEQAVLIREAVQNLPREQRNVIELAYFEELTQEEIAKHCQIPLGTAKSRLRLGLLRLKRMLTEKDPVRA